MTEIKKYEGLVAELQRKREACVQRGRDLADERAAIALEACTGNAKAAKRLTEIHAALAAHSSELASYDAALKAAHEKLAAAHEVEVQAENRQRAEEARALVKELGECFPYLDRHLTEAAKALIAIHDGIAKLHAAGFSFPTDSQFRLGITEVIESWAQQLPRSLHNQLRDGVRFLPPHARKTGVQYFTAIEPSINNQITQHLGKTESTRVKENA